MPDRTAVIDLGTNTFQLLIVSWLGPEFSQLYQKNFPSMIGKGGINQGIITPDALARSRKVLREIKSCLDSHLSSEHPVTAFGTSAVRNAKNRAEFVGIVEEELNAQVQVIDGEEEADLIYLGVRQAVSMGSTPHLIMDIGGGSIEFIIADKKNIFWKQSFEAGGQRLMEMFKILDPMGEAAPAQMHHYLNEILTPLFKAVKRYAPRVLVGSSGSFETLARIDFHSRCGRLPPATQKCFDIPLGSFEHSRQLILGLDRESRLKIPGMQEIRVEMIPVSVCLIEFVLKAFGITKLMSSAYALKEGVLSRMAVKSDRI